MPVSTSVHITHSLQHILNCKPESVLDVGCGFGLWGFLCRMYLDVYNGRVQPEEWKARIDGIELFEPYIQAHHRAVYNRISIGDIRALAPEIEAYDLIIAGDVIEHLEKDEGRQVIAQLFAKARRALLVNIPLGSGWDHPEAYGNPGELHRSQWYPEDFLPYAWTYTPFRLPCGDYGVFFCEKDNAGSPSADFLLAAAQDAETRGHLADAVAHARRAFSAAPADRDIAFYLADLLLRGEGSGAALAVLRESARHLPDDAEVALVLAQFLRTQGVAATPEARTLLTRVLSMPESAPGQHARAQRLLDTMRAEPET